MLSIKNKVIFTFLMISTLPNSYVVHAVPGSFEYRNTKKKTKFQEIYTDIVVQQLCRSKS